jgi:hypothetical protein
MLSSEAFAERSPHMRSGRRCATPATTSAQGPTALVSQVTTAVIPMAWRVAWGRACRGAYNVAGSRGCARAHRAQRRGARSRHHHGLMPYRSAPGRPCLGRDRARGAVARDVSLASPWCAGAAAPRRRSPREPTPASKPLGHGAALWCGRPTSAHTHGAPSPSGVVTRARRSRATRRRHARHRRWMVVTVQSGRCCSTRYRRPAAWRWVM